VDAAACGVGFAERFFESAIAMRAVNQQSAIGNQQSAIGNQAFEG
jgi:hypothetical protein